MIELDNQTDLPVDVESLERIARSITQKEIELLIVENTTMQELNNQHRNIDAPTDVLSFPYEDMPFSPIGSIVISKEYVKTKASEFGHTLQDELTLLFIHGLLHVMGYDHEVDNGEMRQKEQELIEQFHLPKSLIVRTQG